MFETFWKNISKKHLEIKNRSKNVDVKANTIAYTELFDVNYSSDIIHHYLLRIKISEGKIYIFWESELGNGVGRQIRKNSWEPRVGFA